MPEVRRETPSQRMHYRLSVPIFATIDGKTYKAADWSMGGFRLEGYDGPLGVGDLFTPEISIDFRGFHISFQQETKVVRASKDGDGILAASFHDIKEENLELLKYFSEGLLGGEMASFQDAIRRVDMPVTPVDMELIEEAQEAPVKRSLKRILIALAYLLIGGAILLYICITLYSNFWRIEVESGVVVAPTEPLVAPVSGIFEKLIIPPDRSIKLGQPVIQLRDLDNGGGNGQVLVAMNNARFRMETLEAQLRAERATLGIYSKVGDSRLASARERTAALTQDLTLARQDVARKVNMQAKGAASQADLEAAQQLAERLQNELALAENDLRIAHVAISGLRRNGLFFSGDRVEGRGYSLRGELDAARRSLADLAAMGGGGYGGGGGSDLVIRAPFDGHVVRVLKTPGNTVDRGDNLAVIERDDSRYIEVYLTQGESTQVRLGTVAKIFIPSLNIEREARVIQIERTRGFIDETDSRYRWRTTVDRTAVVTLFFINPDGKTAQVKDIITGTPATVSFSRFPSNPVMAGLFNIFRSNDSLQAEKNLATEAAGYEFREVVRMQGPTSRRTEAGTMVTVPISGAPGSATPASGTPGKPGNAAPAATPGQVNATQPAPVAAPATAPVDPGKKAQSLLWPSNFPTELKPGSVPDTVRTQLAAAAQKAARQGPAPVPILRSAGQTDKEDAQFVASRRAFQDADNAANLALSYRILGEREHKDKAVAILQAWAKVNQPTGNPIDETRLDKLIYAYDLLRSDMTDAQRADVQNYLRRMQAAKISWQYGEKTQFNNHRTHQLKMLLLIARALGDGPAFDKASAEATAHLAQNIDAATGQTRDHKERNALHYQAYDLEPWMEIVLVTGCCRPPVLKAYEFLRERIVKGDINDEFTGSTAAIDEKRAKAGFDYAKKGGTFDTAKAARSVLVYQTMQGPETAPAMARLVSGEATPSNLYYLVRQQVWRR